MQANAGQVRIQVPMNLNIKDTSREKHKQGINVEFKTDFVKNCKP